MTEDLGLSFLISGKSNQTFCYHNYACVCLSEKPAGTYSPLPPFCCSLIPNNHPSLHYVWAEGRHGINMIQYKTSGYEPENNILEEQRFNQDGRREHYGALFHSSSYFSQVAALYCSYLFFVTLKEKNDSLGMFLWFWNIHFWYVNINISHSKIREPKLWWAITDHSHHQSSQGHDSLELFHWYGWLPAWIVVSVFQGDVLGYELALQ